MTLLELQAQRVKVAGVYMGTSSAQKQRDLEVELNKLDAQIQQLKQEAA